MCAKSQNVVGKASEQRIKKQEELEFRILGAIHGIIESAVNDKTLTLPEHMDIQQLCFASWSMAYGTITLLSGEVEQCSGRTALVVERELFNQNNLLFDGLQWAPLTKDKDYSAELKKALDTVFSKELLLMHEKGRSFSF